MELSTGIDLNGDGRNGFSIAQSDIANQNAYNELNRRVSLTDDNEIFFRELLPTGSLNKDNLTLASYVLIIGMVQVSLS